MKRLIFLSLVLMITNCKITGQSEFVPAENSVYHFLQKMESLGFISSYNSFEIPKTRKEISQYLIEISQRRTDLRKEDNKYLDDLYVEYEYELYGTLKESSKLFGGSDYNLFSDKEKYLYYLAERGKGNFFVNFLTEGQGIYFNQDKGKSYKSFLGVIGGEFRGTITDKFGFYLKGTNGKSFGDKAAALRRIDLRSNYKFNETVDESFFDNTQGYLTADFDAIRFKVGRDNVFIGYGSSLPFLDNTSAPIDIVGMNIKFAFMNFSYFHAKLNGAISYLPDSITNGSFNIGEKYLGYHRLNFDISKYFNFSLGEFIIYGDRSPDLAYINPFNFYKSAEHSGRDRDNSMLFLDISSKPFNGTKLYSTLLVDDIKFSTIGTGWYGNQTILNAGLYTNILYYYLPLEITLEYQRVEPYVFTHRLIRNNFTNSGYTLNRNALPNSELMFTELRYTITNRSYASFDFTYRIHGANYLNDDGTIVNTGGDINLGHRTFDNEVVKFLDGDLEYERILGSTFYYEFYNNLLMTLRLNYINEYLQNSKSENLESFLTLSVKL